MNRYKLDENGLKMCSRCEEKKPLEEYHNLKAGRYGKCSYCKECAKNWNNNWTSENREKMLNRNRKRRKEKWDKHRKDKSQEYINQLIMNGVRRYIIDKRGKSYEDILGETFDNVRLHIEKQFKDGMSWRNFGEWHIDHIIPLSSGNNQDEWIKLNHYTNLQPLWAKENLQKGAKIIVE